MAVDARVAKSIVPGRRRGETRGGILLGQVRHGPGNRCAVAGPALRQQGQDAVSQEIAIVPCLAVRGILDPVETRRMGIVQKAVPGEAEQRTQQLTAAQRPLGWHPGEAVHAGTAHQAQEKGLDLVVLVVSQKQAAAVAQRAAKNPVAGLTGGGLEPPPPGQHRNALHAAFNIQFIAYSDAVGFPGIGLRREAMVNMQCSHHRRSSQLTGDACGGMQQRA